MKRKVKTVLERRTAHRTGRGAGIMTTSSLSFKQEGCEDIDRLSQWLPQGLWPEKTLVSEHRCGERSFLGASEWLVHIAVEFVGLGHDSIIFNRAAFSSTEAIWSSSLCALKFDFGNSNLISTGLLSNSIII